MAIVDVQAEIPAGRVVGVIDVIRAFTTAAVAFARGAAEMACARYLGDPHRLTVSGG